LQKRARIGKRREEELRPLQTFSLEVEFIPSNGGIEMAPMHVLPHRCDRYTRNKVGDEDDGILGLAGAQPKNIEEPEK